MARNIGPTVDILVERVRQIGGVAVTNDFATQILTISQQLVNCALRRIVSTAAFATSASKIVYPFRDTLTDAADIISVVEDNRAIFQLKRISDFAAYDLTWFRKLGSGVTVDYLTWHSETMTWRSSSMIWRSSGATRLEFWYQVGHDFLILWPMKADAGSVTVEYVKATTVYTSYTTATAIPFDLADEDVELAIKIAETILLLRSRKIPEIQRSLKSLMARLGIRGEKK